MQSTVIGNRSEMMNDNRDTTVVANETQMKRAQTRAEEGETRSALAIKASELRYRRLFETAQDGILILDVDTGRITDVNPFLFNLLGFSRSEIIGQTVGELSPF